MVILFNGKKYRHQQKKLKSMELRCENHSTIWIILQSNMHTHEFNVPNMSPNPFCHFISLKYTFIKINKKIPEFLHGCVRSLTNPLFRKIVIKLEKFDESQFCGL